jgi:uncharacterized membrane protein
MNLRHKAFFGGLFLACASCALLFHGKATAAQPFTFVSFDYPEALSTAIFGINNHGDMVGTYENPANSFHGFVYRDGKFTSIDGPDAAFTQIRAINDAGDIVGTFITIQAAITEAPGGGFQGLLQKNGGSLTVLNLPGHLNTVLHRITPTNLIYGCFHDEGYDNSAQESMHGVFIDFEGRPQGAFGSMPEGTTMHVGGNPDGTKFTGMWYDFSLNRHRSYVFNNGTRVDFDVPGSNLTTAWDMNDSGDVVGAWGNQQGHPDPEATTAGAYRGFLRDRDGTITSIDYPDSIDTKALGINNQGDIVGSYVDANGKAHGFITKKGDLKAAMRQVRARPAIIKASFGSESARKDTIPAVRVALMPIIPKGTPLQTPAQGPACHHVPAK